MSAVAARSDAAANATGQPPLPLPLPPLPPAGRRKQEHSTPCLAVLQNPTTRAQAEAALLEFRRSAGVEACVAILQQSSDEGVQFQVSGLWGGIIRMRPWRPRAVATRPWALHRENLRHSPVHARLHVTPTLLATPAFP